MANLLNPTHPNLVVTSVLLKLVYQHDTIGQFGSRTEMLASTTNTAKIRASKKKLAALEYEAAADSVQKRKAMHVGNSI
jgi:hypothetical protein